jgi:transcriptional regulator with XRE-family HTH domain
MNSGESTGPMHERVRRRREERGIPGYVLAQRLGISPSYVSLIESGKKVPGEDIARRMAEALDDDVELYAAWAHASGIDDLDGYTDRLLRLRRYRSGEDLDDSVSRSRAKSSGLSSIVPRLLGSKARAVQAASKGSHRTSSRFRSSTKAPTQPRIRRSVGMQGRPSSSTRGCSLRKIAAGCSPTAPPPTWRDAAPDRSAWATG